MSKRVLSDECMTTFKYPKEDASGRRSPSGWDGTMKSLLNEALARHQEAEAKEEREAARAAKSQEKAKNGDDQEIEKIVESINVSIKIVGCGGGGSNTVNRCSEAGITGAQLCAVNTDAKHLLSVHAPKKILIGKRLTKGLGAGALPEVGEQAAHENEEEIRGFLRGSHVVFITAGMGGGTGTGSAQYVARVAKEEGALTMGVVTMPFKSEGRIRMENAEAGLEKLRRFTDTAIVIYNDKLLELVPVVGGGDLTVSEAERAAEIVGQKINPQARIIWGCSVDDELEHTVRVLLVITGVKSKSLLGKEVYTGPVKTSAEVDEVR